jgi:O-antigen biosynthesis protein
VSAPRVSAIMPTHNRPEFAEHAAEVFFAQDYPNKELVVIDTGERRPKLPPSVVYLRSPRNHIIEKTAVGFEAASGDVLIHWEDDEWYGPSRISAQAAPIVAGRAAVTGLVGGLIAWIPQVRFTRLKGRLKKPGDRVSDGILFHEGTAAFSRSVLRHFTAEQLKNTWKIQFAKAVEAAGERIEPIQNDGLWVHVRHGGNISPLALHRVEDVPTPAWIPESTLSFWRGIRQPA